MTPPPVVLRALGWLMAVAATAVFVVLLVVPRMTGGAALTVLSGSMTPAYPVGSVVVVRPLTPAEVAVGDVITYANTTGRGFTTHRVIAIRSTEDGLEFTTKGDANPGEDTDPVPETALRGRVWFHVKYLGHLREAVSSPIGLVTIFLLVSLTLVWDRANSFVRDRLEMPARLVANAPVSPSTKAEVTPHVVDAGPETSATGHDPSDGAAMESGDDAVFEPLGVTVGLQPTARVEQQFLLAHLNAGVFERGNVLEIMGLVRGQVVVFGPRHMVVSVSGTAEQLDGVERLLRPLGLTEASRSDVIHVGGEPVAETMVDQQVETRTTPVEDFSALVLGPPSPPDVVFAGAPVNGRPRQGADQ